MTWNESGRRGAAVAAPCALTRRLGFEDGARAVIVNADDFGMCRSANRAITHLLDSGGVDSASIMVPGAWAPAALNAALAHRHWDVGVHLTLTSEWDSYRWRPVTGVVWGSSVSTFVDGSGNFPQDVTDIERDAEGSEVELELQAQMELALAYGVDLTHADCHQGVLYGEATGRSLLPLAFRLCAMHDLPFRLPRFADGMALELSPLRLSSLVNTVFKADSLGVLFPDYLRGTPFALGSERGGGPRTYEAGREAFVQMLRDLPPGVTEIRTRPMFDDEELRDIMPAHAQARQWEADLLDDPLVLGAFTELGLIRIGWRTLRDLQRRSAPGTHRRIDIAR